MAITPLVMLWIALGIATIVLALYRKFLSAHEENYIHLGAGEEAHILEQMVVAHRLKKIDRWGEVLTILTAVGGILLAIGYLYRQFELGVR